MQKNGKEELTFEDVSQVTLEKSGDSCEGVFIFHKDVATVKSKTGHCHIYTFLGKDGKFVMMAPGQLHWALQKASVGDYLTITFLGWRDMKTAEGINKVRNFKVERTKGYKVSDEAKALIEA